MDYHVFRKPKKIKNKTVHRWYYYFYDPLTGKKIQKTCRGCKNQAVKPAAGAANRLFE